MKSLGMSRNTIAERAVSDTNGDKWNWNATGEEEEEEEGDGFGPC